MMKSSIPSLLLLVLLFAAGCNSDSTDPVTPPDDDIRPITFRLATDAGEDAVTRASRGPSVGLETLGIESMTVWGMKSTAGSGTIASPFQSSQTVMDAYQVVWKAGSAGESATNRSDWEYVGLDTQDPCTTPGITQTIKYWDFGATSYRFYAIAASRYAQTDFAKVIDTPDDVRARYEVSNSSGGPLKTFGMLLDGSGRNDALAPFYYSDLWFSNNGGSYTSGGQNHLLPSYGDLVQLMFHIPFVCVRFMFTFPDDVDRTKLRIANIRFADTEQARRVDEAGGDESVATTPLYGYMTVTYPLGGTLADCTKTPLVAPVTTSTAPATTFTYPAVSVPKPTGFFAIDIPYEESVTDYAPVARKWYYALPLNRLPLALEDDPDTPDVDETTLPYVQGDYTLTARINGKTRSAVVPAQYMQWREGHSYTYVFKVTEVGFIFENALEVMTHWQAGNSQNAEW